MKSLNIPNIIFVLYPNFGLFSHLGCHLFYIRFYFTVVIFFKFYFAFRSSNVVLKRVILGSLL